MSMLIRIGALSEQTGVSIDVLRSWERRYGLLEPERTSGGFRLYSDDDVHRVERVRDLINSGISASEAAREVLGSGRAQENKYPSPPMPPAAVCRPALSAAFLSLNEAELEAAIDQIFLRLDLDSAIQEVFIPCLKDLGDGWHEGTVSVAQEHFAVNALRGRLMGLSRGWDRGFGPRAVLACPPDEYHDVSLILFGLALNHRGWRITYLGADTPLEELARVRDTLAPRLIVVYSAQWNERMHLAESLAKLGPSTAIAGADGAEIAKRTGLRWLTNDPVSEADALTNEYGETTRTTHSID